MKISNQINKVILTAFLVISANSVGAQTTQPASENPVIGNSDTEEDIQTTLNKIQARIDAQGEELHFPYKHSLSKTTKKLQPLQFSSAYIYMESVFKHLLNYNSKGTEVQSRTVQGNSASPESPSGGNADHLHSTTRPADE